MAVTIGGEWVSGRSIAGGRDGEEWAVQFAKGA